MIVIKRYNELTEKEKEEIKREIYKCAKKGYLSSKKREYYRKKALQLTTKKFIYKYYKNWDIHDNFFSFVENKILEIKNKPSYMQLEILVPFLEKGLELDAKATGYMDAIENKKWQEEGIMNKEIKKLKTILHNYRTEGDLLYFLSPINFVPYVLEKNKKREYFEKIMENKINFYYRRNKILKLIKSEKEKKLFIETLNNIQELLYIDNYFEPKRKDELEGGYGDYLLRKVILFNLYKLKKIDSYELDYIHPDELLSKSKDIIKNEKRTTYYTKSIKNC